MVALKSAREIEMMRRSGKITAGVLTELMKSVRPGMTTGELDAMAERGIRAQGAVPTFKGYHGFTGSICASVNEEVVHGIPGDRVLGDGDLLSIDIGTTLDGYVSDTAVTMPIGTISEAARRLLEVTQECLMIGIEQMQDGNHSATSAPRSRRTPRKTALAWSANLSATASAARCTRSPKCPTTVSAAPAWCCVAGWFWPSSR